MGQRRLNLGKLSTDIETINTRLAIRKNHTGTYFYPEFDNCKDMSELESIQAWLMDPIACPTRRGPRSSASAPTTPTTRPGLPRPPCSEPPAC